MRRATPLLCFLFGHRLKLSRMHKNPDPKDTMWEQDRILWPCGRCGKVLQAHCGLDFPKQRLFGWDHIEWNWHDKSEYP